MRTWIVTMALLSFACGSEVDEACERARACVPQCVAECRASCTRENPPHMGLPIRSVDERCAEPCEAGCREDCGRIESAICG